MKKKKKNLVPQEAVNIVARSIRIVDEVGNDRILLTASGIASICRIQLIGIDGSPSLEIQVARNEASIEVRDSADRPILSLGTSDSSRGATVYAESGMPAVSYGVDLSGTGPVSSEEGFVRLVDCRTNEQKVLVSKSP